MKIAKFISVILAASVAVSCAPKKAAVDDLPVALQLYSVRGDLEADFLGTLCKVSELGYDGVEFAGLYGYEPAQIKNWCDSLGLVPISAHVPLAEMLADIDKVIADYKAIGCEYIVVPYVTEERRPGGELFMQMIDEIRAIGQKVKDAGLVLLYHNHDFEFAKLENGQCGLDFMYENIPADLLQTELDQCWLKYAGYDPVEYLQKYSGRSPVVHLKDFFVQGEQEGDPYALIGLDEGEKKANTAFEFRPLGHGVQDIPSIIEASKAAGSKWLVVEQDNPSMGKTPFESVQMSIEYLNSLK
ncbi:MAG: sugar phosphate isomerase/epimerase [Bacteroidales bacterium]|jgi:sugar phosphate isomerase/epimerase|nr:sugar phosphate isomerase/epimerase [Bacteroidales bacterium]